MFAFTSEDELVLDTPQFAHWSTVVGVYIPRLPSDFEGGRICPCLQPSGTQSRVFLLERTRRCSAASSCGSGRSSHLEGRAWRQDEGTFQRDIDPRRRRPDYRELRVRRMGRRCTEPHDCVFAAPGSSPEMLTALQIQQRKKLRLSDIQSGECDEETVCVPAAEVAPTWEAEAVRAEQYVKKTKHRYQLRTAQQPREDKAWQEQES